MTLKDRIILVTGGSSGIGLETARMLRSKGARVIIVARNEERLNAAAQEHDLYPIQGDVSREADVLRIYDTVNREFGRLDALINNAGYGYFDLLEDMDVEKFEAVFATNVTGAMLMAREAAKLFKAQKYGNIVNISSTAGLKGFARGTAYAATKFALRGMTECWRAELRQYNVRVILINPSEVQTDFVAASGREPRPFNPTKLQAVDIAHAICATLEMEDRGFVTEMTIWATNPR
ncbi:MAG: SDR family oxidoreductase [Calditrichaeota bacterium]|nr:MAG: SDR family oxidoreductase [Calditrichota bacterium]